MPETNPPSINPVASEDATERAIDREPFSTCRNSPEYPQTVPHPPNTRYPGSSRSTEGLQKASTSWPTVPYLWDDHRWESIG